MGSSNSQEACEVQNSVQSHIVRLSGIIGTSDAPDNPSLNWSVSVVRLPNINHSRGKGPETAHKSLLECTSNSRTTSILIDLDFARARHGCTLILLCHMDHPKMTLEVRRVARGTCMISHLTADWTP